jgi:hypothetical protein
MLLRKGKSLYGYYIILKSRRNKYIVIHIYCIVLGAAYASAATVYGSTIVLVTAATTSDND